MGLGLRRGGVGWCTGWRVGGWSGRGGIDVVVVVFWLSEIEVEVDARV